MKNKFKLLFLIFIGIFIIGLYFHRYHVTSPMPDLEYKKAILKDSNNWTYTLEALRPLMGPEEMKEFLRKYDSNEQIYTPSENNKNNGIYRANLHTHTTCSDGEPTVEYRMNSAEKYAKEYLKGEKMVLAITDHNTVLGAQEVIKILQKNPKKYKNIKVVAGIEIYSEFRKSRVTDVPISVHVLTWCINPYDKYLNEEFIKTNLKDKWNRKLPDRNFDWVITTMAHYGIVGIAHPARYTTFLKDKKYPYITEIFERYSKLNPNTKFTEGYYQSYKVTSTGKHLGEEYDSYIKYINNEAKKHGIFLTGSIDAHGLSLFTYRDSN